VFTLQTATRHRAKESLEARTRCQNIDQKAAMIRTALFGSLTLALVSRPLPGATIYDTGAFTTNGGAMASDFSSSTLTGPIQRADDFVLDGPAEITGVNWWGLYAFSNTPEGQDDFTFRIFADAGGSPASLPLIQFALGNPGRADTGLASFGSEVYAYSALLPSAVTLQGGVMYWLSIVNNTAARHAVRRFGPAAEYGLEPLGAGFGSGHSRVQLRGNGRSRAVGWGAPAVRGRVGSRPGANPENGNPAEERACGRGIGLLRMLRGRKRQP
jgi:hypothetical protein